MKSPASLLAVAVCALLVAGGAWAGPYDDVADGQWTEANTWSPSTDYPRTTGDTAIINSNVVTANWDVVAEVDTALGGGTLNLSTSSRNFYSPIEVTADSWVQMPSSTREYVLYGEITGSHALVLDGNNADLMLGFDNVNFSGDWYFGNNRISLHEYWSWEGGLGSGTLYFDGATLQDYYHGSPRQDTLNNPIVLGANGGTIDSQYVGMGDNEVTLAGSVTGSGKLSLHGGGFGAPFHLTNAANSYGQLEVQSGELQIDAAGTIGTKTIQVNAGGQIDLRADQGLGVGSDVSVNLDGGLVIASLQTYAAGTAPRIDVNSTGYVTLDAPGAVGLDFNLKGGTLKAGTSANQEATGTIYLYGDAGLSVSDSSRTLTVTGRIVEVDGSWKLTKAGERAAVILNNATNNYTGGTDVALGYLEVAQPGALCTGTVTVTRSATYGGRLKTMADNCLDSVVDAGSPVNIDAGGVLEYNSVEGKLVHVLPGGALRHVGNQTAYNFGAPAQNVDMAAGAILDKSVTDAGFSPPAEAQLSAGDEGFGIFLGRSGTVTDDYTVAGGNAFGGGAGGTVYRGLAALNNGANLSYAGTAESNGELAFYAQKGSYVQFAGATLKPGSPVRLTGSGYFHFDGSANTMPAGTTIEYDGEYYVQIDDTDGLPAETTLNVNSGYLDLDAGDAVRNGADVNINANGIFRSDTALTTGSFHVKGGGVYVDNLAELGSAGNFDWSAGGTLVLGCDMDTNLIPDNGKVNLLLNHRDDDDFPQGLKLGNDSRLTLCSWFTVGGGLSLGTSVNTEISLADGMTSGRIAAPNAGQRDYAYAGYTFYIRGPINMPDGTLIIGDDEPFRSMYDNGTYFEMTDQGHAVTLWNTANVIKEIVVEGGGVLVKNNTYIQNAPVHLWSTGSLMGHPDEHLVLKNDVSGTGTILPSERRNHVYFYGARVDDLPGGEHLGTMSPGADWGAGVGVLAVDSDHLEFRKSDYDPEGEHDYEYARLDIDVAGDGGQAGTDHDQVVVVNTGGIYDLDDAVLRVYLPAPSGQLNPNVLNGSAKGDPVDMTIMDGVSLGGGTAFYDIEAASRDANPAVAAHWAIDKDNAITALDGDVILHGAAIAWTGFGGDADLNGVVNYLDLGVLATYYDQSGLGWTEGDFTFDGKVDYMDLGILATNYDLSEGSGGAPVPEPAFAVLLGAGVVGLLRRRRQG